MESFSFDDVCVYVGRLYITSQHEINRLKTSYEARLATIQSEVSQERAGREALEARLIELERATKLSRALDDTR